MLSAFLQSTESEKQEMASKLLNVSRTNLYEARLMSESMRSLYETLEKDANSYQVTILQLLANLLRILREAHTVCETSLRSMHLLISKEEINRQRVLTGIQDRWQHDIQEMQNQSLQLVNGIHGVVKQMTENLEHEAVASLSRQMNLQDSLVFIDNSLSGIRKQVVAVSKVCYPNTLRSFLTISYP